MFSRPESDFRTGTEAFMGRRFLSGYRLNRTPMQPGPTHLYLTQDRVNGHEVVALDASPSVRQQLLTTPIPVWWVPQGQSCVVPVHPGTDDPRFVLTPDFSGCSLLVDQIDASSYRVFHVQGGDAAFRTEYQGQTHGLGLAGFMVFDDYGEGELPRAFICMRYDDAARRWTMLAQKQFGALGVGTSADGALFSTDDLRVRGVMGTPVADLAAGETPRSVADARHGTMSLADG